jgi:dihydrolipoamide dehydrogenase
MTTHDVAIIGAGPGGYVAAIRCAQLGLSAVLVDRNPALGGTCLNVGCISSKVLLESSEAYFHATGHLSTLGVNVDGVTFDLPAILERKERVVGELTAGIGGLMKRNKVTVIQGHGEVTGPGHVRVTTVDGVQDIEAASIVLALGSVPVELPFLPFDGDRIIDSTAALSLTDVPEHLVVIGAGAVGLELGSVWRRLGAAVTVVEMLKQVTPFADQQAAKTLERSLKKQGLKLELKTTVTSADVGDDSVTLHLEDARGRTKDISCDKVLVAVGRRPASAGLALDGLNIDARGRVIVDDHFRTGVPGLYAIGDLVPGPMLAHKAEQEGAAVAEVIAGNIAHVDYDSIPSVVYTDPELASVGATEAQLKEQGLAYDVGRFQFRANGRAKSLGQEEGMAKVLSSSETGKILGVHIVGPRASEMIAEAVVAMHLGATAQQLGHTVHAHPTLSEIVKEAALGAGGKAIHG